MDKWELYTGGIVSDFIEEIGGDLDLVLLDSLHRTPGELLDFLQVIPFLKKNAIIVIHDVTLMANRPEELNVHHTNNLLFVNIRGRVLFPLKINNIFKEINIGAILLDNEQNNFYFQYFYLLGIKWDVIPEKKDLDSIRKLFKKYYDEKYILIFESALKSSL